MQLIIPHQMQSKIVHVIGIYLLRENKIENIIYVN